VVQGDVTIRCFHLANARNHMPIAIMARLSAPPARSLPTTAPPAAPQLTRNRGRRPRCRCSV
jgi:hypothetical protein